MVMKDLTLSVDGFMSFRQGANSGDGTRLNSH